MYIVKDVYIACTGRKFNRLNDTHTHTHTKAEALYTEQATWTQHKSTVRPYSYCTGRKKKRAADFFYHSLLGAAVPLPPPPGAELPGGKADRNHGSGFPRTGSF